MEKTVLTFIRSAFQILYGSWKIGRLPKPVISIFGGARLVPGGHYWKMAHGLATKLVHANISVLTGGGPGIMEAASCGALPHGDAMGRSIGIGVKDLGEKANPCVQEHLELDYFFSRKWLLTRYSNGFVVFPGGFGTLDELAEVLTLMQTKKLGRVPIVLVGVEYWAGFMGWLKTEVLSHNLISKADLDLFTVTDDLEQVFCLLRDACEITESSEKKD